MSKRAGKGYVGKGSDPRIDSPHSAPFRTIKKKSDVTEWASEPFSSPDDALIAEASAIRIAHLLVESKATLLNAKKYYERRFGPRYPFRISAAKVTKQQLKRSIIVTLKSDSLDGRVGPNSDWTVNKLAERARKYWPFKANRVESWKRNGNRAPRLLVAVAKGSGRIVAAFEIDNKKRRKTNKKLRRTNADYEIVPVKRNTANAKNLQGKQYTGDRRGGSVSYGEEVG